jgi:hypothetical protein
MELFLVCTYWANSWFCFVVVAVPLHICIEHSSLHMLSPLFSVLLSRCSPRSSRIQFTYSSLFSYRAIFLSDLQCAYHYRLVTVLLLIYAIIRECCSFFRSVICSLLSFTSVAIYFEVSSVRVYFSFRFMQRSSKYFDQSCVIFQAKYIRDFSCCFVTLSRLSFYVSVVAFSYQAR